VEPRATVFRATREGQSPPLAARGEVGVRIRLKETREDDGGGTIESSLMVSTAEAVPSSALCG
jgi:hypothetical protein